MTDDFEKDGFVVLTNLFDSGKIADFESFIEEEVARSSSDLLIESKKRMPLELLREIEKNTPSGFNELCKRIGTNKTAKALVTGRAINEAVLRETGCDLGQMIQSMPLLFWNDRMIPRLQYDWHQESSYYPNARGSLHLWAPLLRDLDISDGSMIVCCGSHLAGAYPMTVSKRENSLTQHLVNEDIAGQFEQIPMTLNKGDAVVFHQDLIHRTGENKTDRARVSMIVRYFRTAQDFENTIRAESLKRNDESV